MSIDFVKLFSERNIWKISAGKGGKWWTHFRDNDYIGLGMPTLKMSGGNWDEDDDLNSIQTIDEIPAEIGSRTQKYYWEFAKEMNNEDIVIVVGKGQIFGICEVRGDYCYYDIDLPHRREVHWLSILEVSNRFGKICKAVYKIPTTLVRIKKSQKLLECGERFNVLVASSAKHRPGFSGPTIREIITSDKQSSVDIEFLKDISEDILTSNNPTIVERVIRYYKRDRRVVRPLKALYKGHCQFKGCTNMIETETDWYTEGHHLITLGKGGSDHPTNLVILCPQHHKILHHAKDREELANSHNFWYHDTHESLF